ncbi:MAG: sel1 repeat family protein [Candidatus Protistobacter heckmanni]|nr:sel1 repeat family protein [Candidatus Protistobacter heckmanni]
MAKTRLDEIETALADGWLERVVTELTTLAPEQLQLPAKWRTDSPAQEQREAVRLAEMVEWLEGYAPRHQYLACYFLGLMLEKGQGMDANPRRASAMYEAAMSVGMPEAMGRLGSLYIHGNGLPEDKREGAALLRAAADMGISKAAYKLGWALFLRELLDHDFSQGYLYLHLAAELGNTDAKRALIMIEAMHPKQKFAWEHAEVTKIIANIQNRRRQFFEQCRQARLTEPANGPVGRLNSVLNYR